MAVSRQQNAWQNSNLLITNTSFENMAKFMHLATTVKKSKFQKQKD
jgi:hypothetical protein